MATLASANILGRVFAVWPATLQVMPEGILDTAFGRFYVGVRIQNGSTQTWPAAEIHISTRGRRILATAGISVSDGWSASDAAAVGQSTPSEWIPIPALAAGANQLVFFKFDVTSAIPGVHTLDLELRDPTVPATVLRLTAPVNVASTQCHGAQRSFSTRCDKGTLTASVAGVSMDTELFRRVLSQARIVAAANVRTPAETERLRQEFRDIMCGGGDICESLADVTTTCALPIGSGIPSPGTGSAPATGFAACAVFADQAVSLADRVRVTDGSVTCNHTVTLGTDEVINGDVSAGGDVTIGDRTTVMGNVTTAGAIKSNPGGGAHVNGLAVAGATYVAQTIATKTVTPGTSNITVGTGATQTITPGSYGTIQIGSNSTVTVRPGIYHCTQFVVNTDTTLILDQTTGTIDVRVRDNLTFSDRDILKVSSGTPPGAVAQFYTNQSNEVRLGTDITSAPLAITAPSGTIHVYSRTNVQGSLIARNVTVEPDCAIGRVPVDDWSGTTANGIVGTGTSGLEFLGYPTSVSYSVAYRDGYQGATGPLAFDQVSWKALLADAMLLYDLGLPGPVGAALVSMADQAVIGSVKTAVLNASTTQPSTPPSSQAGSVDAAICTVRGNRALGYPLSTFLDAATGEPNATPITALDGKFSSSGLYLTNVEIDAILAQASNDPAGLRVHKSSAGTGVTHGLISALVPVLARDDDSGTLYFTNQLLIAADPNAPAASGKFAGAGDSGGLWIQTRSNKVLGLGHMVGTGGATISRIEDVVNALQIKFA